ncbi:MAG TPA: phasin family protein [Steroidobacteraceae bacterium]|nr:phasin family protein [Steroidobacteraceae bacterium]
MTLSKDVNRQMNRFAKAARARALLAAEFGSTAVRGSRELTACNFKLGRELVRGVRSRVEQAAAAGSVGAAFRSQVDAWPATRERLVAGIGAIRATLDKAFADLQRSGLAVIAPPTRGRTTASPKRRRRSTVKSTAAR